MLKTTPFHDRTAPLCAGHAWRRWAGYVVASSYELTHEREYWAIRSAAALFDVSPLYKYLVRGPHAARLLDRVVTRDVIRCRVGQVLYTPWCNAEGKVLDDGTVARLEPDLFRLTSAHPNLRWLHQSAAGLRVTIEDVTERTAALAIQGPAARRALQRATDADLDGLGFFRLTRGSIRGLPVTITRTGYTGDLGYEVWIDAEAALRVWDGIVQAGTPVGLLPAGILALDVARVEAGLILVDVDYVSATHAVIPEQLSTPEELGLGWTVSGDKGPHVGQEALRAERARGPAMRLVGLEVEWESLERLHAEAGLPTRLPSAAWRTSVPVYADGRQVGYATSGCWSPLLKKAIALAHLEPAHSAPGARVALEVTVQHRRRQADARVVPTPFFDPERKRAKILREAVR